MVLATQGSNGGNGTSPYYQAGYGTAGNFIQFMGLSGSSVTLLASQYNFRAPVDGIEIVATPKLTWTGTQSGNWNTADVNWHDINSNPAVYADGSGVVFDDTATGTTTVDISGSNVAPASVTFSNSVLNYTLQSNEGYGITGITGLNKSGTGTLTISSVNSFTGPVTLGGGTIQVGSVANAGANSPLGAGTDLLFAGGILEYTGTDATPSTNRAITLGAAGGTLQVDNPSTVLTFSGNVIGTATAGSTAVLTLSGSSTGNAASVGAGESYVQSAASPVSSPTAPAVAPWRLSRPAWAVGC